MRRFLPALALTAAACTAHRPSSPPRAPVDAPDHFLVVVLDASGTETTSEPLGNPACRSPLQDPDGARLTLERSSGGQGDYAVEEGRYGVRAGELLRVECATAKPLGIVPR
jgi:hypothetical protein